MYKRYSPSPAQSVRAVYQSATDSEILSRFMDGIGSRDGENVYLYAQLDPWNAPPATIPDLNMTATVPKDLSLSYNLQVGGTGSGLFMINFASRVDPIRIYAFDPSTERYNYLASIVPDEDLSEFFQAARFISGGFAVVSATVTGTDFTVAGTLQAIQFQDVPDVRELSYPTLLSYSRSKYDSMGTTPVSVGLCAHSMPHGDHSLKEWGDHAQSASKSTREYYLYRPASPTGSSGWLTPPSSGTVGSVFRMNREDENTIIPPNAYGRASLDGVIPYAVDNPSAATDCEVILTVQVDRKSATASTWVEATTTTFYELSQGFWEGATSSTAGVIPFHIEMDDPADLYEITIGISVSSVSGQAVLIAGGLYNNQTACFVKYSDENGYGSDLVGPGAIIAFEGLSAGQQMATSGILKYEAVPNADLARNVSTTYRNTENPMDLKVAEAVMYMAPELGIRSIYRLPDYQSLARSGHFRQLAYRDQATFHAASLWSGIRKGIRRGWEAAKPILRDVSPVLGGAIGSAYGMPVVGRSVGKLAGDTLFSATTDRARLRFPQAELRPAQKEEEPEGEDLWTEYMDHQALAVLLDLPEDMQDTSDLPQIVADKKSPDVWKCSSRNLIDLDFGEEESETGPTQWDWTVLAPARAPTPPASAPAPVVPVISKPLPKPPVRRPPPVPAPVRPEGADDTAMQMAILRARLAELEALQATGKEVGAHFLTSLVSSSSPTRDALTSQRLTDMMAGIRSQTARHSKCAFPVINETGIVKVVELLVTEDMGVIDDRDEDNMLQYEYQEVPGLPNVFTSLNMALDDESIEQIHLAVKLSMRDTSPGLYVTFLTESQLEEGSFGLALYSAMCNFPFGPVVTGMLSVEGRVLPVAHVREKMMHVSAAGRVLIAPYKENLAVHPGMATPLQIAACFTNDGSTPPLVYLVTDVGLYTLSLLQALKAGKEVLAMTSELAHPKYYSPQAGTQEARLLEFIKGNPYQDSFPADFEAISKVSINKWAEFYKNESWKKMVNILKAAEDWRNAQKPKVAAPQKQKGKLYKAPPPQAKGRIRFNPARLAELRARLQQ